jgi:uncharacterized membrane protein YbhN (UPF0104 family)
MWKFLQRPAVKVSLRAAVSIALLALLLCRLDLDQLLDDVRRLSPAFVLFAWAYYAGCQLLSAYRWQLLLKAQDIHVPLGRLFSFYMAGMFLNNFMPGAVGGDVAKVYQLYRHTGQGRHALVSVFLERFTGLVGLALISVVTLLLWTRGLHSPWIVGAVGGTALFLGGVVVLIWWPPLSGLIIRLLGSLFPQKLAVRLQGIWAALADYRNHRGTLVTTVALSVFLQGVMALFYALVAQAMGIDIKAHFFLLFLPVVAVVTLLPISIGGLGLREAVMVFLFGQVGVSAADVLAVSLTAHLLNTALSLWGGVLLLWDRSAPAAPAPAAETAVVDEAPPVGAASREVVDA